MFLKFFFPSELKIHFSFSPNDPKSIFYLFFFKQPRNIWDGDIVETAEWYRGKTGHSNTTARHTTCQIIPLFINGQIAKWLPPKLCDHITYSYVITYSISVFHITAGYWLMEYSIRSYLTPIDPIYNLAARLDFLVFQPELMHVLHLRSLMNVFIYLFGYFSPCVNVK